MKGRQGSETAAVCRWRCPGKFLEVGDEMVYILIPHFIIDFMHFHVCLDQQIFRGLDPHSVKILQGRGLETVFKVPAYSVLIFSVFLFQFFQGIFLIVMGLKFRFKGPQIGGECSFQGVFLPESSRPGGCSGICGRTGGRLPFLQKESGVPRPSPRKREAA